MNKDNTDNTEKTFDKKEVSDKEIYLTYGFITVIYLTILSIISAIYVF